MREDVLSVERTIPAPPHAVFDVLADPARHHLIDGSGMVQGALAPQGGRSAHSAAQRLAIGRSFGMKMKLFVRYSTANRVTAFEEDRMIAWQTGPTGFMGKLLGGRIWRYELEPVEGGTCVRESWDIGPDHQRALLKLGGIYWNKTRCDMERTLERLERLLSGSGTAPGP